MMDYEELFKKYLALAAENKSLKEENEILKAKLGIPEVQHFDPCLDRNDSLPDLSAPEIDRHSEKTKYVDPSEKIRLFKSLFRGRDDVYAKRWENRNGRSGYTPVCLNEWRSGLCRKPAGKCFQCPHQSYDALDEKVIESHLKGNIIIGVYPLCQDETCHFLAMDFDDEGWRKDTSTLREVCMSFDIPVAIERSREAGLNLVYKSKIHQNFAVLDRKIIWYGSINLLSFCHSEESIMRLESSNIAYELIRCTDEIIEFVP